MATISVSGYPVSLDDTIKAISLKLDDAKQRIIANMGNAGQIVSGKTAESLKVERVAPNEVRLVARPFFSALETGSQPWSGRTGEKMNAQDFQMIIFEWASRKGIIPADMKPLSFAYVVARKIMNEGSKLYRQGGRKDIFTPEIERVQDEINESISGTFRAVMSDIIGQILRFQNFGTWQQ